MAAKGFVHELFKHHDNNFSKYTNTLLKNHSYLYPSDNLHTHLTNNGKLQLIQAHDNNLRNSTNDGDSSSSIPSKTIFNHLGRSHRLDNPTEIINKFNKNSDEGSISAGELLKSINMCDCPTINHNNKKIKFCTCEKE